MCLLITRPYDTKNDPVHDEWLRDWYKGNKDGFGFMYADGGVLNVDKELGTPESFIAKWRKYEEMGVDFACHLRMRTHGNTDLENCHPYQILGPESGNEMWLMHNGVLSYGNKNDTTKSDTWHFIKDWLRPLLDPAVGGSPKLMFKPAFKAMLASLIGSNNKLVIMDCEGDVAIINHDSGVKWAGMWLSNRYAWSAADTNSKDGLPRKYSYPMGGDSGHGYEGYGTEFMKDASGSYVRRGHSRGAYVNGKFMTHEEIKAAEGKGTDTKKPELGLVVNNDKPSESQSEEAERNLVAMLDEAGDEKISSSEIFMALKQLELMLAWQRISYPALEGFMKSFSPRDVYRLADLVIDEKITETEMINCMSNHKLARTTLQPVWAKEVAQMQKAKQDAAELAAQKEAARVIEQAATATATVTTTETTVMIVDADGNATIKPKVGPVDAAPPPTGSPASTSTSDVEPVSEQEAATEATLAETEAVAIVVPPAVQSGDGA